MGWIQAVDVIQEAHENIMQRGPPVGAGLSAEAFFRLGFPTPDLRGPRSDFFQLYVDNFDQGKIVLTTDMHQFTFKPSGEQLAVRAA